YATPDRPLLGHRAQISDDGRWLLIVTSAGTDARYELHAIDLARPDAKPITLVKGLQHNWVMIGNVGTRFYFVTNKDAPRQRIVAIDLERPRRRPMPVVLER